MVATCSAVASQPLPLLGASPREPIMFVVDWDDTLLPSAHLAALGFADESRAFAVSEEHQVQLRHLAEAVVEFLTTCCALGRCFIVTNAHEGWVQRTCKRFLPQVLPLLDRVTVISARSKYEHVYPGCPCQWKIAALSDIALGVADPLELSSMYEPYKHDLEQIVAIGDSPDDRAAIQYVGAQIDVPVKSIKLLEDPTILEVKKQLALVAKFLPQLCSHRDALDLALSPAMLAG